MGVDCPGRQAAIAGLTGVERVNALLRGVIGFPVRWFFRAVKKLVPFGLGCVDFMAGEAVGVSERTLILERWISARRLKAFTPSVHLLLGLLGLLV